ncbi:MAG TPA: FAD-binding oxidoreductase [Solirubrobacterales bacterium]|jgi:FAD/FMN-containing dehydrogenase|nr:FAD-binding oxidoreductase [Solirubrobacterales bacterium]
MTDFSGLAIAGRIATPNDSDWDRARMAWNLAADQRPSAVAFVESGEDIAAVVRFAAENGLRVSGQGTGHGAVALGSLEDAVLIKTERMRGIEIDAGAQTARVEAGVLSVELAEAAQQHGLSGLPGSSPDVGVAGYHLGGGLSWFGRQYGFACNRLRAIELVTADGETRTVDAENEPDLFWALRGGGGDFAVVIALHIDLVPVADAYGGAFLFPGAVGAEAVRIWRDWAAGVGENVTSVVRFLRPPDIPDVPEPLRGTPLLTIDGACIGSREEGEAAFAPLLEIGEPMMNTFDQVPPAALCRIHMDPEQPVPGLGHHRVLRELPDEAIEVFASMSGPDSGTPLLLTEIRQLGGALSRPAENGGALSHLDAGFAMFGIGMPMTPELGQAIEAHHDRLHEAMEPWAADGGYFNFAERPCDADAILPADVCARLADVKRQYDPDGRIVGNHAVSLDPAA